jgi:hypothetical protein
VRAKLSYERPHTHRHRPDFWMDRGRAEAICRSTYFGNLYEGKEVFIMQHNNIYKCIFHLYAFSFLTC